MLSSSYIKVCPYLLTPPKINFRLDINFHLADIKFISAMKQIETLVVINTHCVYCQRWASFIKPKLKHNVKMIRKIIELFLLAIFLICKQTIIYRGLLKNESILTLNFYDSETTFLDNPLDLEIESTKIIRLQNWIYNNDIDWRNSIASFTESSVLVVREDFRKLIFKEFVVIGFKDKNDESSRLQNVQILKNLIS
jgi:hypothetical protein